MTWGALLSGAVSALVTLLKALFGMDTPKKTTVDDAPPPIPKPTPEQVLRDLGLRSDGVDIVDDVGVHDRTNGRNPVRGGASGSADPDSIDRDSER